MENQPPNPKIVLKVNINCCEACPKKLDKALSKLTGVSSHTINMEENLVSISGTVDPNTIIKLIYAKIAKKAKLVSYEPQTKNDVQEKHKDTKTVGDKDTNDESKSQHEEKMHKSCSCCCCCKDGNCPKMGNNVHKCEDYDPPPEVKDFVCKDYFCKLHPRDREITDKLSANEISGSMYGYWPNYGQGYYGPANSWYPIRNSYYPRWNTEQPPAGYGYYQLPRRPQPSYGFY